MYHAFAGVSRLRARTMYFSTLVKIADVRVTKAFSEVPDVLEGTYCRAGFKGLGMGDGAAIDIAQESHCNGIAAFWNAKGSEHFLSLFVSGVLFSLKRGGYAR